MHNICVTYCILCSVLVSIYLTICEMMKGGNTYGVGVLIQNVQKCNMSSWTDLRFERFDVNVA